MFEQISTSEILKWVALVFLAGFIGFFGKYLGRVVLSLFQKKSVATPAAPTMPDGVTKQGSAESQKMTGQDALPEKAISREEQKLLKKTLKNEAKAKKKGQEP